MTEKQTDFSSKYLLHAYHLAETLKLKEIDRLFDGRAKGQSSKKLVYEEGERSCFFIHRFGSVVFFNVAPERQGAVLEKVKAALGPRAGLTTIEEFVVEVRPGEKSGVGFENATFGELSSERIDILSLVLAQSTALEHFEIKVDDLVRQAGYIGFSLKERGKLAMGSRETKRFIGRCISTKQELVASLYLLDKPDETWNDEELDALYREASEMFELRDRYRTLDYKLRMIQENLELISELLQHRNANSLEVAIVVLIAVEVVLFVLQIFLMG